MWWYRFPRVPTSGLPAANPILPVPGKILKSVTLSFHSPLQHPASHRAEGMAARSCRGRGKKKRLQGMLAASKGAVTYSPTFAVPSAWRGLTSLFGMGRGGAPALSPPWSFAFVLRHAPPCMTGVSQERRRSVTWKRTQDVVSNLSRLAFLIASLCCRGAEPRERVRAISNARLCALLHLHLRPIYVVVYNDPMWRSYLGEGFVLRCFQHLS